MTVKQQGFWCLFLSLVLAGSAAFGEDRVIFGGDWPVCTLGASLAQWIAALKEIVAARPTVVQDKLFNLNAEQLYHLG